LGAALIFLIRGVAAIRSQVSGFLGLQFEFKRSRCSDGHHFKRNYQFDVSSESPRSVIAAAMMFGQPPL